MFKKFFYKRKINKDLIKEQFLSQKLLSLPKKTFNLSAIYNNAANILIFLDEDDKINFSAILLLASLRKYYTGKITAITTTKTNSQLKEFLLFDELLFINTDPNTLKKYPKRYSNYLKKIANSNSDIFIILKKTLNIFEKYLILNSNALFFFSYFHDDISNFKINFERKNVYIGEYFLKLLEKLHIPSVRKEYFEYFLKPKQLKKQYIGISSDLFTNNKEANNFINKLFINKLKEKYNNYIYILFYTNKDQLVNIYDENIINLYGKELLEQLSYLAIVNHFITKNNIFYHLYPYINEHNITVIKANEDLEETFYYTSSKQQILNSIEDFI